MALWLIQRCFIKSPLAPETSTLSQAVRFDYMGSAEFEFGTLPKSLRLFRANKDAWRMRLIDSIKEDDSPLRVFSYLSDSDFETYAAELVKLREAPEYTYRLKERSEFALAEITRQKDEAKRWTEKIKKAYVREYPNFWWDVTGADEYVARDGATVMFGFRKEFMNRLPQYLEASFAYMDAQKQKQ